MLVLEISIYNFQWLCCCSNLADILHTGGSFGLGSNQPVYIEAWREKRNKLTVNLDMDAHIGDHFSITIPHTRFGHHCRHICSVGFFLFRTVVVGVVVVVCFWITAHFVSLLDRIKVIPVDGLLQCIAFTLLWLNNWCELEFSNPIWVDKVEFRLQERKKRVEVKGEEKGVGGKNLPDFEWRKPS